MQNQKEYLMNQLFDCYSRLLIDNHISDHKPEYMKQFSPEEYVRLVKLSEVESSMVYACDHNGNCYYPSKVGHVHNNLDGRDIFGETVSLLKKLYEDSWILNTKSEPITVLEPFKMVFP